ncbi:DegV family protein [Paenibacillus sp. ACRRX]|uniref:DegV family protein n=1 Tax=unclassified Paenibacillus TaxID=185978 RepID=UPI001EF55BDC|nr:MULTISPECIES: DegV family protein [unclassified Paenibacillus]MCG7406251.1 DegV family protein [Paenibacillus sp. ACRRX]MDK8179284.1 DegV family protein [Paenibacillus sp. UMB4589-SE434]
MTIHIITDGSSDLTPEIASQFGINVVPLYVRFGQDIHTSDMDSAVFYERMRNEEELPKTSSPSPGDFYNMYKSLDADKDILVLCLTSQLSSTYNHAVMAKSMYEEDGHTNRVEVIDTKTASMGLGLLAVRAALMAKAGKSLTDMNEAIKQCVQQTRTYFTLDTLENAIRGGRLNRLKGTVASMLNIKVLMRANEDGVIETMEKIRGTQRALKRMIEKVGEAWHHADRNWIALAHSNCEERAKEFLNTLLEKYPFENVLFVNMGPVIGTYAGEGGVLLAFEEPNSN